LKECLSVLLCAATKVSTAAPGEETIAVPPGKTTHNVKNYVKNQLTLNTSIH